MKLIDATTLSVTNLCDLPNFREFCTLRPPEDPHDGPRWSQMVSGYTFCHIMQLLLMQLIDLTTLSIPIL